MKLRLLLPIILFLAPIYAFVVPWSTHESHPSSATQPGATRQRSSRLRNIFPQFTWLRDTAIEKFFDLPKKSAISLSEKAEDKLCRLNSHLPATLLAKYGGEVVLRFNLSTAEEEYALAEAAETLFLDVWEFTNNWADIRLREDDVCIIVGLYLCRCHSNCSIGFIPPWAASQVFTESTFPSNA
jgi:extracellular matrix protein 14